MIDIEKILNEIKTLPAYESQISLQTVEGEQNPSYGTGKVKSLEHSESCFKIALFPQLTYLNSVIESLGMYRTRLMNMSPKTCYTYHRDLTKRIHIPLITNENCFMVIEDKCFWYPADGNHYLVDTTKPHTFVNASREYRLHIVGCVDENN
jgi:hypothetical protein